MVNKQVEEEIGFYEQQAEIVSYLYMHYNYTWTDWSTIQGVITQVMSNWTSTMHERDFELQV